MIANFNKYFNIMTKSICIISNLVSAFTIISRRLSKLCAFIFGFIDLTTPILNTVLFVRITKLI